MRGSSELELERQQTVLFAVLGTTPSVLTETVWALAQEEEPVLPDRIVVLTTTVGREALRLSLFAGDENGKSHGWNRLINALRDRGLDIRGRLSFGLASDHVRLFPSPSGDRDLADIGATEENAVAADFILRELRAHTENPLTRVFASIAGGRKTMSALLLSCMSLLGRSQDRVLHVLVNAPFDQALKPSFLFPEKGVVHLQGAKRWPSSKAKIELIDVPFVRMRGWYEGAFKTAPPTYAALVSGVQKQAPTPAMVPALTFDRARGEVTVVGGLPICFSPSEFAAVALLCQGVTSQARLFDTLRALAAAPQKADTPDWVYRLSASARFDKHAEKDSVNKTLSSARKKVETHPLLSHLADALVPKRGRPQRYPPQRIRFTGPDIFADVRG